jgi:hypothetical protein
MINSSIINSSEKDQKAARLAELDVVKSDLKKAKVNADKQSNDSDLKIAELSFTADEKHSQQEKVNQELQQQNQQMREENQQLRQENQQKQNQDLQQQTTFQQQTSQQFQQIQQQLLTFRTQQQPYPHPHHKHHQNLQQQEHENSRYSGYWCGDQQSIDPGLVISSHFSNHTTPNLAYQGGQQQHFPRPAWSGHGGLVSPPASFGNFNNNGVTRN